MNQQSRLVVVSNRLPISVSKKENKWEFKETGGGLATALGGLKKKKDFLWVGWIGRDISKDERENLTQQCKDKLSTIPVYLSNREINQYYNGFSNRVLWPLFHYTPDSVHFDQQEWETYQKVNQKFAEVIANNANTNDIVWIHDFHLMLVPSILRELRPDLKIGFFLHIPFPSSEIFRILPVRKKLIEGILGSDLIGFHCFGYERHFISTVLRLLGCQIDTNTIYWQGRKIKLGVYPIGINPEDFEEILQSKKCQQQISILKKRIGQRKLILGVDRLDYSKGIPHKLSGFSWFLEKYPEYQKEVLLYQVAVPSRTQVEEYQDLKFEVDRLVGDINGKYASVEQSPIYYLFKSVSVVQLVALYALADMMLITSIRDGMNLVALEYVICNQQKKGSLLLSEFTGVAHSLGGANLINPWDQDSIADGIKNSLTASMEQRDQRHQLMYRYAKDNSSIKWADHIVNDLEKLKRKDVTEHQKKYLFEVFKEAKVKSKSLKKRLFFLDYDGTLVGIKPTPEQAYPSKELLKLLHDLAINNCNEVYLISGRKRRDLENWFYDVPVFLAGEHGFTFKKPGSDWKDLYQEIDFSWKDQARSIMNYFTYRTPGSWIEEKPSVVAWHYRQADPDFGKWQAEEILDQLKQSLSSLAVDIIHGHCVVEVRPHGVHKGKFVEKIMAENADYDFIFCAGDDRTDEEMFKSLPYKNVITCKVGEAQSFAEYFCKSHVDILSYLKNWI